MANAISQAKNMSAKSHGNDEDITCGVGDLQAYSRAMSTDLSFDSGKCVQSHLLGKANELATKSLHFPKRQFEEEIWGRTESIY